MRGRSLRIATWLIMSVVLGCAPAPSPTPSITPPPVPADVVPWPDLVWSLAEGIESDDPTANSMIAAVTSGRTGFVAVGYEEVGAVRDGRIWLSEDGETWTRVGGPGAFDDVELLDVAPARDGFVALGVGTLGAPERPHAVFLRSADGRAWRRLVGVPGSAETYPQWISGGPDGLIAAGSDVSGGTAIWRSGDGDAFERVDVQLPPDLSVTDPHVVDGGYVSLGGNGSPAVLLRSDDAERWSAATIDPAGDVSGQRLVLGHWGYVVQGSWAPTCAANASCPASAIGWWSADGGAWGRLPREGSPISNGGSIVVPAGMHGMVAIDGASAWSSPDGWAWRPLPEPGDGTMLVTDAVVEGDVIVAVGATWGEDGISRGAIVVAR